MAEQPKCDNCGHVAICIGQYESATDPAFACDECCGHGNEDGWCYGLGQIPDLLRQRHDAHTTGLREGLRRAAEAKDIAYAERNQLVAALSKVFPSALSRHPESDTTWEDDWRWIVFVDLPTGQATWHIHDSELGLFDHLPREQRTWDGHTTEEKYARLARLVAAPTEVARG